MKGTPRSQPSNHVEWVNGFKSNMPDWITARECAHSHEAIRCLKEARTLLFQMSADAFSDQYYRDKLDAVLRDTQLVLEHCDGLTVVAATISGMPMPGGINATET